MSRKDIRPPLTESTHRNEVPATVLHVALVTRGIQEQPETPVPHEGAFAE